MHMNVWQRECKIQVLVVRSSLRRSIPLIIATLVFNLDKNFLSLSVFYLYAPVLYIYWHIRLRSSDSRHILFGGTLSWHALAMAVRVRCCTPQSRMMFKETKNYFHGAIMAYQTRPTPVCLPLSGAVVYVANTFNGEKIWTQLKKLALWQVWPWLCI